MDNCTILIADDEPRIRNGLSAGIDWESISCSVCAVSKDGKSAMQDSLKYSPDIIISDINMPRVNGLDFCKNLKANNQESEIIILTGYDQFDYAQSAIEIGVRRFIVKPVDNDELLNIVKEIAQTIRKRRKQKKALAAHLQEFDSLNEKKLLVDLLNGQIDHQEFKRRNKYNYALQSNKHLFCVVVVSVENPSGNSRKRRQEYYRIKQEIGNHLDSEIIHNTIVQQQNKFIIPICFNSELSKEKIFSSLEWVQRLIFSEGGPNLSIGIGNTKKNVLDLSQSLSEARDALAGGYFLGTHGIWKYEKALSDSRSIKGETIHLEIDLYNAIQNGSAADMRVILIRIDTKITTMEQYGAVASQIVLTSLRFIGSAAEHPVIYAEGKSILDDIPNIQSRKIIFDRLSRFLTELCHTICKSHFTKNYKRVEIVKKFIDKNLAETLNLDTLSRYMGISPSYLSSIFKAETGENLSTYITRIRIDKAKELLEDVDIKTYQVAYQTGFNDPNYFNAQFKKTTGVSPGEFQKLQR